MRLSGGIVPALIVACATAIALSLAGNTLAAHGAAGTDARAAEGEVTIVWGGDVHLGRAVAEGMSRPGHSDPFDQIKSHLRPADLRIANLEGPLTTAPRAVFGYYLTGDPDSAKLLADAGFDVLGLGNNHATDNGGDGLDETRDTLRQLSIDSIGGGPLAKAYGPVIVTRNGLRIAVLAFNYIVGAHAPSSGESGVAEYDQSLVASAVAAARDRADLVFVMPHWGVEYATAANGHQRRFARELVDAGADAVIGHHPHVVQDIEWLERDGRRPALVVYSLGNLVFDGLEPDTQRGALLWTAADHLGVTRFRALPIRTDWLGTEPLLSQAHRDALTQRLTLGSTAGSRVPTDDGHDWFGPPEALAEAPLSLPPHASRRTGRPQQSAQNLCLWLHGPAHAPFTR